MDEIGRNGFKKIILFNGHGGNVHLLHFLAQCSLWEEKPYSVYLFDRELNEARQKEWDAHPRNRPALARLRVRDQHFAGQPPRAGQNGARACRTG